VLHRYSQHRCAGNALLFTSTFFGGTQEKVDYLRGCPLLQDSYAVLPAPSKRCLEAVDAYYALIKELHYGDEAPPTDDVSQCQMIVLRNWLHNLLLEVEREYRLRKASLIAVSDENSYMLQFKALLDEHYQTEKKVSFYAAKLKLSEKKLSTIVYSVQGFSAKEYINGKMLQEAIWLLKNTTLNQGEIAYKLGFDFTYFVKFFRKHTGITPAKYRQKMGAA
jgi:AraC-like DNA-binding protein